MMPNKNLKTLSLCQLKTVGGDLISVNILHICSFAQVDDSVSQITMVNGEGYDVFIHHDKLVKLFGKQVTEIG